MVRRITAKDLTDQIRTEEPSQSQSSDHGRVPPPVPSARDPGAPPVLPPLPAQAALSGPEAPAPPAPSPAPPAAAAAAAPARQRELGRRRTKKGRKQTAVRRLPTAGPRARLRALAPPTAGAPASAAEAEKPPQRRHPKSRFYRRTQRKSATPRKFKPGTVALREIRFYQKTSDLLISKAGFARLVREVVSAHSGDVQRRIQGGALLALQEAAEKEAVRLFEDANLAAVGSTPCIKLHHLKYMHGLTCAKLSHFAATLQAGDCRAQGYPARQEDLLKDGCL